MLFETRCAGCDRPGNPVCTTCRFALVGPSPWVGASGVIAAVPFAGRARDVILGSKSRNRRAVGRHLAGLLVNRLIESGRLDDVDVVTFAPTAADRQSKRKLDQGEFIARAVGSQLGLPVRPLLDRHDQEREMGRSQVERCGGPSFAARLKLEGLGVLIVDDVVTTGATLREARRALEVAGAHVECAAVAATPAPAARGLVGCAA